MNYLQNDLIIMDSLSNFQLFINEENRINYHS